MLQQTPRSVVKALLRGEQAVRPLLMPLTFALASRIDNLARENFVVNPTKIVTALRQIRSTLKLDGVTCYFDPYLETEALGGKVVWGTEGPKLTVPPQFAQIEDLRARCGRGDEIVDRGRIPIAADVLKRLRTLLNDEPALMVGVTGPLKLAAQLAGTQGTILPGELIQFAAEIVAAVAKYYVEAGADVVLLRETLPASSDVKAWESWVNLLDPLINVARFYEALTVLLLDEAVSRSQVSKLLDGGWECAICVPAALVTEFASRGTMQRLGIAFPVTSFESTAGHSGVDIAAIRDTIEQVRPVLVTTAGDLPPNADLKQVARLVGQLRQALSSAA
jgi:hypothetical protein